MTDKTVSGSFQESLWRGEFGDAYVDRNEIDPAAIAARTSCWSEMLKTVAGAPPVSILEVGANVGRNLRAIQRLSAAKLYALEPNAKARERLVRDKVVDADKVMDGIASKIPMPDGAVDLVFTFGVLIHIHPDNLLTSMSEIYRTARRYIICAEYFADKPTEVSYRGHTEALFKRDFGGHYLDNFPKLKVVDYGFFWNRLTAMDNTTWWVLEKQP
jgi:pseudaminic acid biosynthesis-associated methylase